jgi:heme/copper-type cytochrome/quinol oxidase subunit 2
MQRLTLSAILITVALCGLVAWATPRPLSDLYIALAGGRDVIEGKLGQPDDWAYTTEGRTWINQSWGSDTPFYLTHSAAGNTGLLVLKALILAGIAWMVVLAARERGATLPAGLLAASGALIAAPPGMILRPNLVSLLFVPLLLFVLYRSRNRPRWLWGGVVLLSLWANLHGAFIVGLGILALWALGHVIGRLAGRHTVNSWPPVLAFVLAVLLAGFANPFGIQNLTLPLSVAGNAAWRQVTEWRPVFGGGGAVFPTPWPFLIIGGLVVMLGIVHFITTRARKDDTEDNGAARRVPIRPAVLVFEVLLVVAVLVLAFQARRFIPLASVVLAPLLAVQLEWVLRPRRRAVPTLAVSAIAVALVVINHQWLLRYYDPDNPRRPAETFFERMVHHRTHFPVGVDEFLNANEISGRVFHEWRWEGYLRWISPQVKLFVGGRAQQVYDEPTYWARREILASPDPAAELRERDIHIALVPLHLDYAPFCQRLLIESNATWAYIYSDRKSAVLADIVDPNTRRWVEGAARGALQYPDPAVASLSRGMCLASPAVEVPPEAVVVHLHEANRLRTTDYSYAVWESRAKSAGMPAEEIIAYLEDEMQRLNAMPVDVADGMEILKSREDVAALLGRNYPPEEREKLREVSKARTDARDQIRRLQEPY